MTKLRFFSFADLRRAWVNAKARSSSAVAATLWLMIALLVALPQELLDRHLDLAAERFFRDLHFVFISFLVFVDVIIGVALLDDDLMKRAIKERALQFIVVLAANFLVLALAFRHYQGVPPEPFWLVILVVISVWLMRFWSFSGAYVAIPVDTLQGNEHG